MVPLTDSIDLLVLDSILSFELCSMAALRSQEASSSASPCSYHVFLSFRGEDTRKTFTDHLYTALDHAGFRTFRDDDEIERGEDIKSELQKAIQESRISIVVLSRNYASSGWCLDELVMILKRRKTSKHVVLPIFYDVDPSHVRKQMGSFKEAFTWHEEKIEAETGGGKEELKDKVRKWRAALREVADLAGMTLQNQADGHEARFIQKIIKVVGDKLSHTILDVATYPIGLQSRAKNIQLWLDDWKTDVGIVAIYGMGGIGKTTIAKYLYNLNFSRFEGSSFLANVREISKQQDGLLCLQRQLLSDILKGRKEKINNIDEGIVKIKDAICCKRVLVVLDDVDKRDQLDAVLGMRDWLSPGSKIVITTRREHLLRGHEVCKMQRVEYLNCDESLELFSWHAFGKSSPSDDYAEVSKRVVHQCGGLPLAIKVLGSSLCGKSLEVWSSQLEKLKAIPEREILEKLKISYDSLQDDHDKDLFLHVACFFVGKDNNCIVTILDGCGFYTRAGIQNLIDRCLLTIDVCNKLIMHQLLQEMGREIVRLESPKELGERSRLWNHMDSFNVLRQNIGSRKIEGLILDTSLLKEDKSARTVFGVNRKRRLEEIFDSSLLSNVGNSLKRYRFGIFSWKSVGSTPANSNQVALETDSFASMHNLKLLQLSYVQLSGSYGNFPKELKWLYWRGFPLESIPSDFLLESVVVLEMPYSSLKCVWKGTKFLKLLKTLDLSHSQCLIKTPDFSELPNLERLVLKNCVKLFEFHESVGHLERLVLLSLKDCKSLRKLPRSIGKLKSLETLDISGCSNLENLPTEMRNIDSLTVLRASDVTSVSQSLSNVGDAKAWSLFILPSLLKLRKNPEISWVSSLPRSLEELSLVRCNLSDDAFPEDLSNLSSLKKLDLSDNPICGLPDCIRGLTRLKDLQVESCTRLQSIAVVQDLDRLHFSGCRSLEKINFLVPASPKMRSFISRFPLSGSSSEHFILYRWIRQAYGWGWLDNLVEISGELKVEPLENVDAQIVNNLGLFSLSSMGRINVMLSIRGTIRKLPLQGCHQEHVFDTYLPGSKVPSWFNLTNKGSSISFTVPPNHNRRIRGLSFCTMYALSSSYNRTPLDLPDFLDIVIHNTTKRLIWGYAPVVYGVPEADEDMLMWLSYWKFENHQLEGGDELNISLCPWRGSDDLQVKEVGVHLVCEEEKEEKITQQILSTSEEEEEEEDEVYQPIYTYGNVLPGNASLHPSCTKIYCLGRYSFNPKFLSILLSKDPRYSAFPLGGFRTVGWRYTDIVEE